MFRSHFPFITRLFSFSRCLFSLRAEANAHQNTHAKDMETLQTKLFEAATQGSINSLRQLLKEDPLILDRAVINCFNETSLHVAAMLGHVDFVKEIIHIKPKLLDEVNSQQSTALHMAAAAGHAEVVRALLSPNGGVCLALDRERLTPLHLAAAKGRVETVKLLLEAKPDAACRGESILHLCVKRYQLEALEVLVKGVGDGSFVNSADENGNTVLHLAVQDKQVETVKFLLSVAVEVNAVNEEGMTALDVLIRSKRDVRDSEIEKILKHKGGQGGNSDTTTYNNTRLVGRKDEKSFWKGSLERHEAWLEKTKSGLMVVAVLISTMAFQIGVNPPGGVWQDDLTTDINGEPVEAGSSILAQKYPSSYEMFYIVNTIAFMAPLTIILLLMSGLPLRRRFFMWILMVLTWIAITTIALCYLVVIDALTPLRRYDSIQYVFGVTMILWLGVMALLLLAHTVRLIVKFFRKMRKLTRRSGNNNIVV